MPTPETLSSCFTPSPLKSIGDYRSSEITITDPGSVAVKTTKTLYFHLQMFSLFNIYIYIYLYFCLIPSTAANYKTVH